MSDLDFLMSLNGYHLPFYEKSTKERSMYEYFHASFLDQLIGKMHDKLDQPNAKNDVGCAEFGYIILQECIFQIHMITEYWVTIIECIIEIITIINKQIDSVKKDSAAVFVLKKILSDPNKVFHEFKSYKLLKTVSEDDSNASVQLSESDLQYAKIERYSEALTEAIVLYKINCTVFLQKIDQLKDFTKSGLEKCEEGKEDENKYNKILAFINDIAIYIREFEGCLQDLEKKNNLYETTLESGFGYIKELQDQANSPKPSIMRKLSFFTQQYNPWK